MPVIYEPCPRHPKILLPIAIGDTSKHLCPFCGQEERRATYAKQKADVTTGLIRINQPPPVRL